MLKKFFLVTFLLLLCLIFFIRTKPQNDKLVFWSIQLKPVATEFVEGVINEFETENPDIKVQWIDIPVSEAEKRTLASILTDNPPDLVNLNPDFSIILAQKNALQTFDTSELSWVEASLLKPLIYEGKVFAVPFYASSSVEISNNGIIPPRTYEDLLSLKTASAKQVFASNLIEGDTFLKILNKYGINSPEKLNSPLSKEVFGLFKELYTSGRMPKDTLNLNHREVIEKYMSSSVATVNAAPNFIKMIKENAPDVYKNSVISAQLSPHGGGYDVSLMNLIIPKRAKHKEKAFEFAKILTSEKNQLEFAKLTNVLPVNKETLQNPYFKICKDDLISQSRCISAKQLAKPTTALTYKNKKEVTVIVNKAAEEVLLNKKTIDEALLDASKDWEKLNQI